MAIKKCTITTDEFIIKVYSESPNNQSIDVKSLDGKPIILDLHLEFSHFSYPIEEDDTNYGLYYYIKCIVEDALKYIEYWEDITEPERWSLIESRPFFIG